MFRKLTGDVRVTVTPEEVEEEKLQEEERIMQEIDLDRVKPRKYLPDWQEDPLLRNSNIGPIPIQEEVFWNELIELYLKPYDVSEEDKVRLTEFVRVTMNLIV